MAAVSYNEIYLDGAMKNAGEMLDYAVTDCGITFDGFWKMFIASGVADSFGDGTPKYIAGLSGVELAINVFERVKFPIDPVVPSSDYSFGKYYWCGWILAYYQWIAAESFSVIYDTLPCSEVERLYPTLHEASELRFVETADAIRRASSKECRLKRVRRAAGLTQAELAKLADVNLRTLQQYESRSKDINKAQAGTLLALSKVLFCSIEELLEPQDERRVEYALISLGEDHDK